MTITEVTKNGGTVSFRFSMTLGLAGTIAAGIWWAAVFAQEVDTLRGEVDTNRAYSEDMGKQVFSLRERAAANDATGAAVKQRLNSIDSTLQRIESKMDRAAREDAQ